MFRPIAGPFLGSMTTENSIGPSSARAVELCFASLAILLGSWAAALTYSLSIDQNWAWALAVGSFVTLAVALLGQWFAARELESQREICKGIYGLVLLSSDQNDPCAVQKHSPETPFGELARFVVDTVRSIRKQQTRNQRMQAAQEKADRALLDGRAQATALSKQIDSDAALLTSLSEQVDISDQHLAKDVAALSSACDLTNESMSCATNGAVGLTESIRATSVEARHMTEMAVQLSQAAHATHKTIAALADRPAALMALLDKVSQALLVADQFKHSGTASTHEVDNSSDVQAQVAAMVQDMAATCLATVEAALDVVSGLSVETAEASQQISGIVALITLNHEVGQAVGCAVHQQSEKISVMLDGLNEARSGFAILRAGVDAVASTRPSQKSMADTARQVALTLPHRAERVASILRSIPDFASRLDV